MDEIPSTVYVVDDDVQVRDAIADLCRSAGFRSEAFPSTEEFFARYRREGPACLVLDLRFPGTAATGLEFQRALVESGISIPIVFISGHADVRISVEAMKRGAVEFLPKPFREQELLDAIRHGIERDRAHIEHNKALAEVELRIRTLTSREHEIMLLMVDGLLGKQIAARLGVSEMTVKVHRARMLQKLQVSSHVELVRLIDRVMTADTAGHSVLDRRQDVSRPNP